MKSELLYNIARELMPAGVSSPVRAYKPFPRFIKNGKGSKIYDVDDNEFIDYCMGFGPLILGHAHPYVMQKIKEQLDDGVLYGAPIEKEIELAKTIKQSFSSIDMVRMVNTGTGATMHALRLARGFTGKDKIIKIEGAFHGAHDAVLVKAGSGATTHSMPTSLGIPVSFAKNTILAPFNDIEAMETVIKENKNEIAGVIIEPIMGNIGVIPPNNEYLNQLREITEKNDILLIFDEVITGFRIGLNGAQGYYNIKPDLTTLGKIVGGGLPIGIFGGRKDIMEMVSPQGNVYQAGTFSGNPLSLTSGLATIKILKDEGYEKLNENGEKLRKELVSVLEKLNIDYQIQGFGSMFQLFFTNKEVINYEDAKTCDTKRFNKFFLKMLDNGIFLPPSQFETNFLSMVHSKDDMEKTINAFEKCLKETRG